VNEGGEARRRVEVRCVTLSRCSSPSRWIPEKEDDSLDSLLTVYSDCLSYLYKQMNSFGSNSSAIFVFAGTTDSEGLVLPAIAESLQPTLRPWGILDVFVSVGTASDSSQRKTRSGGPSFCGVGRSIDLERGHLYFDLDS
jgi:hypothetical protein